MKHPFKFLLEDKDKSMLSRIAKRRRESVAVIMREAAQEYIAARYRTVK